MRLLDLQRRLPRAGPQPGPRAQAHRQPAAARMGLRLAAQPPRSCTTAPRPIPKAGPGRSARSSSGGTRSSSRWVGDDRAGLRAGQAARLPAAAGRDGHGGHRRRPAVHHEARRPRLAVRPRRVKDGPLPTHYEPVESPVGNLLYPKQTCNPTVRYFEGPLNPHRPHADGGVPGGGHARSGSPSTT